MTLAICTKCGSKKWGALTACAHCGFDPASNEDRAKAVVLSDHHFSHEVLEEIGSQIQNGEPFEYPPDLVDGYIRELEVNPHPEKLVLRRMLGCALFGLLTVAAVVIVVWVLVS